MVEPAHQELKFSPWQKVDIQSDSPSARYGHVCALLGSQVYLFGGTSSTSYSNDLYSIDLSGDKLKWTKVEQKGDIPSPRESPTLSAIDEELFLFGGLDKEGSFSCADDLFVFKAVSNTWKCCETTGPAPQALSLTASVSGHRLVLFGGVLNGEAQNSVHILDTITLVWTKPDTGGTPPPVRCDHTSVVMGDKLYITCGSGSDTLWYSDLYTLDLSAMVWECVEVKGEAPVPRDCTSLSIISGQYLVLFGGFSGSRDQEECFSDLHIIDLSRKLLQWEAGSFSKRPPPRYGHAAVVFDKKVYVFSGQDLDQELSDVWCTAAEVPMTGFEPVVLPRVRYTPPVPIPCPRKVVTPVPPKAGKPRDFEELRTTYMKRINEMFDTLTEKFQQLDSAVAVLESERSAYESEKKAHTELYERQQQELKEMMDNHRVQNEEWLEKIRQETDAERRELARQRATLDRSSAELSKEQEEFALKSKKLDAIMKQVQGLSS